MNAETARQIYAEAIRQHGDCKIGLEHMTAIEAVVLQSGLTRHDLMQIEADCMTVTYEDERDRPLGSERGAAQNAQEGPPEPPQSTIYLRQLLGDGKLIDVSTAASTHVCTGKPLHVTRNLFETWIVPLKDEKDAGETIEGRIARIAQMVEISTVREGTLDLTVRLLYKNGMRHQLVPVELTAVISVTGTVVSMRNETRD